MVDMVRGLLGKIHDMTCPGAFMKVKPVQKICPMCDAGD
jgi:hypothetical protein